MATELRQKANDVFAYARKMYQEFSDRLTDAQRHAAGKFVPYSAWSAADVLGHITFWNNMRIARLEAARRGDPLPEVREDDVENAEAYAQRDGQGWENAWAEARGVLDKLAAQVETFPDDKLGPYEHEKRPVWRRLDADLLSHAALHFADYWYSQNEPERAVAEHQAYSVIADELGGPDLRAIAIYNLACYYAKTGDADRALPVLKEVLMLRPDMTEWSRQDPDLASLHENPAAS
jgi:hypothetical protein